MTTPRTSGLALTAALAALLSGSPSASADEGMWTLNGFPKEAVEKHGFSVDQAWLDDVRLSSVRLANGCSGSLVSPDGLVLTNHHCAHGCIEQLSTKKNDLVEKGFLARDRKAERRCPALEINQLVKITDVTEKMHTATKGLEGAAFKEASTKKIAELEKACATSDAVRCDVVTLYKGGRYDLYEYRRYQDVRLVFAPELEIAFFGGDPDNFNFPRYVIDMALLRIWGEDGPVKTPNHFEWSEGGSQEGELVFVSGHPGSTRRLDTVAQLAYLRDVFIPDRLLWLAELRGQLTEFSRQSKENERIAKSDLFSIENAYKAYRGRHAALLDEDFFASKVIAERSLRNRVEKTADLAAYAGAWDDIARAMKRSADLRAEFLAKEWRGTLGSTMLGYARDLVRYADEKEKPNERRLPEYTESKLPALRAHLLSKAPIYPKLERLFMVYYLTKLREELGPDDPFTKQVLGKESPESLAGRLLRTKMADVAFRKKLFEGGKAAVAASKDPMIAFARSIDDAARTVRKKYEAEVESIVEKSSEKIAKARFAVLGTSTYPDATFTLRVSYGKVAGFPHRGTKVEPYTTIAGAFERETGRPPFRLPASWHAHRKELALDTPMNLVTTNDIIGGNSGSPLFNTRREIVGLIFDGNIYSLGGDYGFDPNVNRSVAVDSRAIVEALRKIYGAKLLLEEIGVRD